MNSLSYQERIRQKLAAAFQPIHMEILDDSARHKGHAGHPPTSKASADKAPGPSEALAKEGDPSGETHFKVRIVSAVFKDLSRIERHRLVYESLAEELKERVHALNIEAFAPQEIQP